MDKLVKNDLLQDILLLIVLVCGIIGLFAYLRYSVTSTIDETFAPYVEEAKELEEARQELIVQAEEHIDEGWTVSLDGYIIESAVDLSLYHIKLDEESKTVILTTPVSTNSNKRTYTYTPIYFPIPIIY